MTGVVARIGNRVPTVSTIGPFTAPPARKLRDLQPLAWPAALPSTNQPPPARSQSLAQPRAGVEAEEGAAANRIPLGSECRRLADHLQVAPYFGQTTPGLERGASAVPEHQVHRLACAVARVHRGEPA